MTDQIPSPEITLSALLQAIKDGNDVLRTDIQSSEARLETRMTRLETRWEARFLDHEKRIGVIEHADLREEAFREGRTGVFSLGRRVGLDVVAVVAVVISVAAFFVSLQPAPTL